MKNYLAKSAVIVIALVMISMPLVPSVSYALEIVPCGNEPDAVTAAKSCNFDKLILLAQRVMDFMIFISIPIATIIFTYVGVLILTSQGNTGTITKAKGIAWNVLIGFIVILSAWLLVRTILVILLDESFNMFLK